MAKQAKKVYKGNRPYFPTYEDALLFVEVIKKSGYWPGIMGPLASGEYGGQYTLTSWPSLSTSEMDSHGY